MYRSQQYLPFTVLKLVENFILYNFETSVATVLTVYGIETSRIRSLFYISNWRVATVLTVYGIETKQKVSLDILMN